MHRLRWIGAALALLAALLGTIAAGRPWHVTGLRSLDGRSLTGGLLPALCLLLVVLDLLLLVVRRVGHRVVGVLVTVTGAGMAWASATSRTPAADVLAAAGGPGRDTGAWLLGLAGGLLAVPAGLLIVAGAGARGMGRTPTGAAAVAPGTGAVGAGPEGSAEWWKAMDAGLDPTADEPAERSDRLPEADPEPTTETPQPETPEPETPEPETPEPETPGGTDHGAS